MSIVTGIGGGIGSRDTARTACSGIRRRAKASTLEPFAGGRGGGAGGGASRTAGGALMTRSRDGAAPDPRQ